jgi:hypothetical protein
MRILKFRTSVGKSEGNSFRQPQEEGDNLAPALFLFAIRRCGVHELSLDKPDLTVTLYILANEKRPRQDRTHISASTGLSC